jgi:hypothetical protein
MVLFELFFDVVVDAMLISQLTLDLDLERGGIQLVTILEKGKALEKRPWSEPAMDVREMCCLEVFDQVDLLIYISNMLCNMTDNHL